MAEGKSPLDGILEENTTQEKEAKPLSQASSNHKPEPSTPTDADSPIRRIRNDQAADAKYISEKIKQLESMIMAMRALVGITALAAAYSVWKVRKIDKLLESKKGAVIEVEASTQTNSQVPETSQVDA